MMFRQMMMTPLRTLDAMFLEERRSVINSAVAEQLAREIWGAHQALEHCEVEADIRRPRNAGKEWRAKGEGEVHHEQAVGAKKTGKGKGRAGGNVGNLGAGVTK